MIAEEDLRTSLSWRALWSYSGFQDSKLVRLGSIFTNTELVLVPSHLFFQGKSQNIFPSILLDQICHGGSHCNLGGFLRCVFFNTVCQLWVEMEENVVWVIGVSFPTCSYLVFAFILVWWLEAQMDALLCMLLSCSVFFFLYIEKNNDKCFPRHCKVPFNMCHPILGWLASYPPHVPHAVNYNNNNE